MYFASQAEVKQHGELGSSNGAIDRNQTDIWSCSFDADRSGEIAQLRRNDAVTLEGQLVGFLNFRHCRVVANEAKLPSPISSVEPDRKPHAIYQPDPPYTRQAEKARLQGIVELSILVGADGHTSDVRITRSLGMGLDESAIATVGTWRFEPALRNDTPIPMRVTVEVTFKLYP